MKFVHKALVLLLASFALSSCGGGGGNGGGISPPQNGTITLTPEGGSLTLPLNVGGANVWSPGSPYSNEVDIHWTNPDGSPVSGHDLSCSVSNLSVISIHILDDPSTPDDESAANWGNIQTHSDTGHAVCFVFSMGQAGTATFTVGGVDPVTGATISKSLTFTVQNASSSLPASLTMTSDPPGVYFSGSNGNQSSVLTINVLDGGQQPVPDPASGNTGADNVLLEIVTNPSGNARLSANSVSGPVTGASVATHTVNGIATASFQSGNVQGPIQIRATSDRSDNNVTNGIADPVSTTFSVIVSDGKLFSIELTSPVVAPNLPGITINSISGDVSSSGTAIPPDPDATLSLAVTALAKDRQDNPVLPGTSIHFGAVDEPVGAPGSDQDNQFLISGSHGDPQEGGTLFTATDGQFLTAGGGAGPGDALVVFDRDSLGNIIPGNADLISALTVQTVNSETSLAVSSPFNRNDLTGASVNSGPVLSYLVGRGVHGSITSVGATNDAGVAHSSLTYTVNSVGNAVAIWAQGDGIDTVTNGQRRVTDAGTLVYPGLAPATMVVTPLSIAGNSTANVTVCITDALGISLRGVPVGFLFNFTGAGSGSVDGTPNTGTFDHLTGVNGCATGQVVTSGIPGAAGGGDAGTLDISAAGQTQSVTITAPAINTLTVNVVATSLTDLPGPYTVTVGGSPTSPPSGGAQSCTATVATAPPANMTCTYTFTQGASVTLQGTAPAGNTPSVPTWTGTCTNGTTASSQVTMAADATCTATW
jgi:hypothetical protein